ncbi:hypothetical protein Tco_1565412 [Tanacetum coccineum]
MAESLIDLENVLRSKQGKLSSQEANFLMNWKESTLRQLTVGACAGGAIAWSGNIPTHDLNSPSVSASFPSDEYMVWDIIFCAAHLYGVRVLKML